MSASLAPEAPMQRPGATDPVPPLTMLTPTEVMVRLGVDESQLRELVNDGRLAGYRLGAHLRFRHGEVMALLL